MTGNERKRASLFGNDDETSINQESKLNLSRFTPKKAAPVDEKIVDELSKETGFITSHARKPEAPEMPVYESPKRDGRKLKRSGRTTQFNIRLKPENANRFWAGAECEGYEYADHFLSHLLTLYESSKGHN